MDAPSGFFGSSAPSPLSQYGYYPLNEIEVPVFGTLRLFYKFDTEEIWLQRLDGSLSLIAPTPAAPGSGFYYQDTVPVLPSSGDRWVNSITGFEYTYITDDSGNSQWVQFR